MPFANRFWQTEYNQSMTRNEQKLIKSGLNALIWKEGKLFVAKAIEIEVASQGKTKKEAVVNLEEALDLYLEDKKKSKVVRYSDLELIRVRPESGHLYA